MYNGIHISTFVAIRLLRKLPERNKRQGGSTLFSGEIKPRLAVFQNIIT
jgi:hypothetical protein